MPNRNSLDKIFYPKSIAVIGASNDKDKIGGFIFSGIIKQGEIYPYPINLKSDEIQDVRAYKSISDIKKKIDLAIIAIPSDFVNNAVLECAKSGIKNIIIISAGFKETGDIGKQKEEALKQIISKYKLNVVGPNCLGILNPQINLNCSFAKNIPKIGDVALISQSGAVIDAILDWSFKHNIGFSKIVSLGNMAGVDELQILEYLKNDNETNAIIFYMETLEKGKQFAHILKEVSKKKPVIIIKPGKSDKAKKAIGSHTGSLAQDNILVETLICENNGILIENLNELYNILIALKGKIKNNDKLAVVTNAGGIGVIATDEVSLSDFDLYELSDSQKKKIAKHLPQEASVNNPIDILGDGGSQRYFATLKELDKINDLGNILVLLTPQIMTDCTNIAKKLIEFSQKTNKNIFASFLGDRDIKNAITHFDIYNFPNFQTPAEAIKSMDYLLKHKQFKYEKNIRKNKANLLKIKKIHKKLKNKKGLLDYELSKEILSVLGIDIYHKQIIKSENDISELELSPHRKYAIKADGGDFIHKKDIGGVITDISYLDVETQITNLFSKLKKTNSQFSITVEEMVCGVETICGLKHDEELGNFIMFGMGGTYVSVFKDINFSMCPLTKESAKKLVEKSKVNTLLKGFRGSKPINYSKLYDVLIKLSYLYQTFPQIKEVDFNPVICNHRDCYLVDVKLIL